MILSLHSLFKYWLLETIILFNNNVEWNNYVCYNGVENCKSATDMADIYNSTQIYALDLDIYYIRDLQ
jgi:hypothetical protein